MSPHANLKLSVDQWRNKDSTHLHAAWRDFRVVSAPGPSHQTGTITRDKVYTQIIFYLPLVSRRDSTAASRHKSGRYRSNKAAWERSESEKQSTDIRLVSPWFCAWVLGSHYKGPASHQIQLSIRECIDPLRVTTFMHTQDSFRLLAPRIKLDAI